MIGIEEPTYGVYFNVAKLVTGQETSLASTVNSMLSKLDNTSVYCEYVFLSLVNKEAALTYSKAE